MTSVIKILATCHSLQINRCIWECIYSSNNFSSYTLKMDSVNQLDLMNKI